MDILNDYETLAHPQIIVHDAPKFDLDSYISNYSGRTKFDRLFLIGTCSTVLGLDALKAAVIEAKSGSDVRRYELAVQALQKLDPSATEAILDKEWVARKSKLNAAETERLEQELKGYKNNLIKESIRMGNEDLGSHYHQIGDLTAATKIYGRMRDYCTTPAHIASMLFRIIQVSIDRGDWLTVTSNVSRVMGLHVKPEESARNLPRVNAAQALSLMAQGHYHNAALSFLQVDPALTDTYNEVLTSNDVAVYGGLCALASMDRNELTSKVLESSSFRQFLELEPHIRRAISFFCSSKYSQCLEILEAYRADYLLDIYLQSHVQSIYAAIRSKAIVSYFAPFSRVTLASMAQVFFPTVADTRLVDEELINMIEKGVLDAKIDLEKRVLVSKEVNLRADVHETALGTVGAFTREAHLKLLRMNALAAGIEVKGPSKKTDSQSMAPAGELMEQGKSLGRTVGIRSSR